MTSLKHTLIPRVKLLERQSSSGLRSDETFYLCAALLFVQWGDYRTACFQRRGNIQHHTYSSFSQILLGLTYGCLIVPLGLEIDSTSGSEQHRPIN